MAQSIPTLITTNFNLNLIQLWWQLLISNVCLWRRSLRSNLASIDPEKLYRATFICQFGLCCFIIWPLFLFDCFVKNWATCKNFWATGLPPTLGTRGFSRVRREFSVLAEGRSHEWRSREKNLWHVACVAWRFWLGALSNKGGRGKRNHEEIGLSNYIYTNQIESLQLYSCGPAREEMSKDPHYP